MSFGRIVRDESMFHDLFSFPYVIETFGYPWYRLISEFGFWVSVDFCFEIIALVNIIFPCLII